MEPTWTRAGASAHPELDGDLFDDDAIALALAAEESPSDESASVPAPSAVPAAVLETAGVDSSSVGQVQGIRNQELHPNGQPRRPMNAFMIFARHRRPTIQAREPGLKTGEISRRLSHDWKILPETDKAYYLEQAKLLKDEFHARFPDYVYKRRPNNSVAKKKTTSSLSQQAKSKPVGDNCPDGPDLAASRPAPPSDRPDPPRAASQPHQYYAQTPYGLFRPSPSPALAEQERYRPGFDRLSPAAYSVPGDAAYGSILDRHGAPFAVTSQPTNGRSSMFVTSPHPPAGSHQSPGDARPYLYAGESVPGPAYFHHPHQNGHAMDRLAQPPTNMRSETASEYLSSRPPRPGSVPHPSVYQPYPESASAWSQSAWAADAQDPLRRPMPMTVYGSDRVSTAPPASQPPASSALRSPAIAPGGSDLYRLFGDGGPSNQYSQGQMPIRAPNNNGSAQQQQQHPPDPTSGFYGFR